MRVLLVNPPIYDFTAYDFWLRPFGLMRVAGMLQHAGELHLFDFLQSKPRDAWGRGRFLSRIVEKPRPLRDIPRNYRRFGRPREEFRSCLSARRYDAVLVQTMMTYWYPGVREVIEDIRALQPSAKIVLGGVYASLCPAHALSLGPDLVVEGANLEPLWKLLSVEPAAGGLYWPAAYSEVGILKLSDGCPFRCTYCAAPLLRRGYSRIPLAECLDALRLYVGMGAGNVAFYDDALLFRADEVLRPFLDAVIALGSPVRLHTPNALNARFIDAGLAQAMVRAGFESFFLGLESCSAAWQDSTGGKVSAGEFESGVECLRQAGAGSITAYIIAGHPGSEGQELEASMRFACRCGVRVLLSEFSPIPGTPDGVKSEPWADMREPLSHNKTAFAIRRLGPEFLNSLKNLARSLNSSLPR